ncbi:MAG: hypothetical protein HZA02_10375 [Nitrospinae bacterium]|nr:hypothetical protein [Nitrospinota bacterium]
MKLIKERCLMAVLAGLLVLLPNLAQADSPQQPPAQAEPAKSAPAANLPCSDIPDADKANLCRAKLKPSEENANRYQNKDHRTYYCSLITDRDMQTYCYAIASHNKTMCGDVVDKTLETECNSSF